MINAEDTFMAQPKKVLTLHICIYDIQNMPET